VLKNPETLLKQTKKSHVENIQLGPRLGMILPQGHCYWRPTDQPYYACHAPALLTQMWFDYLTKCDGKTVWTCSSTQV